MDNGPIEGTSKTMNEQECVAGASSVMNKQKSLRQLMGETVLRCMIMNIENENVYLHQFKELLSLEDYCKTNKHEPDLYYIYGNTNELYQNNEKRVQRSISNCLNNESNSFKSKPKMIGEQSERIMERTELLNKFALYSSDEQSYENFLDLLIDLEESFTEN